MRIISGSYKGRRIIAPNDLPIRPTTDFAKEALFNILRTRLRFGEIEVLELFAGSGNVGFEFASRGVPNITAVDAHAGCIQFIEKISKELSFPIHAVKSDVLQYLQSETKKYDVIFADPPYELEVAEIESIIQSVFQNNLLKDDGILIVEHVKQTNLSDVENILDSRNYGGCVFSFFGGEESGYFME